MKESVNEKEIKNVEIEKVESKQEEIQSIQLFLEREKYKGSDGKDYWNYIVNGKVRERVVKADFIPKDRGGYEVLDLVFDVKDKAELLMVNEKITDSNGNVTKYISYRARTIDELGIEYVVDVKPKENSDKALLGILISQLKVVKGK